jgi:hypothetical protein
MKALKIVSLLAVLAVLGGNQARAATSIGVEFLGRDGSGSSGATAGNPATPGVGPNDTAGVVPQQLWNVVDDYRGSIGPEKGESSPLIDSTITTTTVTLSFDCNDSWYNNVAPTNLHTPNAHLMNGIIKSSSSGGVPGVFTFNNVPDGQYDLYVYLGMDGDKTVGKFWDRDGLTTYYVTIQHQFYDTNTFVLGTNRDPAGVAITNVCNYIKFSNLGTYGRGTIGILGQWVSGNNGIGVAALQLVNAGPPQVNTNPVSITQQPASRRVLAGDTNVTFTVNTLGPVFTYQWYSNGVAVADGTNVSILVPPIVPTDNSTTYYVIVSNNVNNVKSANAVITVGQLVQVPGVVEKLWYGATLAGVEAGNYDNVTPDISAVWGSFSSPEEQGDNFTERLNCLFKPPVTTNYTFFITSDDNSDLFISTDSTPANKRLVAQETAWSNPFEWVSDAGGGVISQKRTDQWTNSTGTAPNANGITLDATKIYYIEAVHNEGGGGDKVDVTFKIVGEPDPVNGDVSRITAFLTAASGTALDGGYIAVTNPPANTTGIQSQTATLTIGATSGYIGDTSGASPGIAYQWQQAPAGSSTFASIAGANGPSYTTPILKLSDNGTQFRVAIVAGDATTNSSVATLTVLADTTPPRPVTVTRVTADGLSVTLMFDGLMDKASTETASGYKINPGNIVATNASLAADGITLTLTTGTPLAANVTNVLTITQAKDLAGNLPAANTTISFMYQLVTYQADIQSDQPIAYFRFEEPVGAAVATNSGTSGVDGAYYTGDEASPMVGGVPSSASGDVGPRPPDFKGFPADNHSATFDGSIANGATGRWVDAKVQYLQGLPAFSLEYWVMPTNRVADPTTFGTRIGIVGQNDAIEYGFIDQNDIQIWTPNGGSLNTVYSFPDDTWHHVATIADGTTLKTYYDGALVGTGGNALPGSGGYGTSGFNVHIGGGGVFDGGGNYFIGNIDEVAIFNKAIPAARIAEHFNAGKSGGVITTSGAVTPPLGTAGPTLSFARSGNTLTISWAPAGGTLQSTTAFNGAATVWTPVGSANPATITIGPGNSYYRVAQ